MKIIKLLPLLLFATMLSACGNDDEPNSNTTSVIYPSSMNIICSVDASTGAMQVLPGAEFGILVNFDDNTVLLQFSDLQYERDTRAISFTMPEMRLSNNQLGWVVENPQAVQVETNKGVTTISNLVLQFADRRDMTQNVVALSMTIDNRYNINTVFQYNQFVGTTTSKDITDASLDPFSSSVPQYFVTVDYDAKTARISMASPRFSSDMPSNLGTMILDDVPVTFTSDGFTFEAESVIPQIGDTPYPRFVLTNISGTVVSGKSFTYTFECAAFNRRVNVTANPY